MSEPEDHKSQTRKADLVPPSGGIEQPDPDSVKLIFDPDVPDEVRSTVRDWREAIADGFNQSGIEQRVEVGTKLDTHDRPMIEIRLTDRLSGREGVVELCPTSGVNEVKDACRREWIRINQMDG